jgi:hypothetical protein
MPSVGGESVQLTKRGGSDARESPDRRFVYYTKVSEIGPGLWCIPTSGGEEVQVLDSPEFAWWDIVQNGIYFVDLLCLMPWHPATGRAGGGTLRSRRPLSPGHLPSILVRAFRRPGRNRLLGQ